MLLHSVRGGPSMLGSVTLTLNGQVLQVPLGTTILGAARVAGISIPTLCHDERLRPLGGCRMCLVEVSGETNPVTACATPAAHGTHVLTETDHLRELRRGVLLMLARRMTPRPPGMPPTAVDRLLAEHGVEPCGAPVHRLDDAHPYIRVDMDRCIYCLRCIRICDEVQGQNTWYAYGRGGTMEVRPDSDSTLRASSCVSCGACADTCPSGALFDKSVLARGAPASWTRTVCSYCGVGCELEAGTRDGRLVEIRPALDAPVNKGHLCVKGRYAFDFVTASGRVTTPLVRGRDGWRRASWPEAVGIVAGRLRAVLSTHGPSAVGVLGSARATNEDNYVAQKFARVVLNTNNVDSCARVCHAPSAAAMKAMLGTGAATNSFDDIEAAQTLLVVGANVTECHPVVGARIRQRARQGASLIVIDPRRTEIAREADLHLAPKPGTDVLLLNAIGCTLVEESLFDAEFIGAHVDGWNGYRQFVSGHSPERVAATCGVDAELIRRAARIYASGRPAVCFHGLGLTEHVQGTAGVMCLVNLALVTGNIGKPGTGVNPLRGQNNVQGAVHMGCEPRHLTGAIPIEQGRALFEKAWDTALPSTPGLDLMEMLDGAAQGALKALWVMGYDVAFTNPNASSTLQALRALDLVIIQDLFMTETAREFGSVFLPSCSSFEKDGTFMNAERRIQRVRAALPPAGESLPDWQAIALVARAMGCAEQFSFGGVEQIWNEIRSVWPAGRGITYGRLDEGGLQWPCPDETHPGTRLLHATGFADGPRASLRLIQHEPSPERTDAQFPLVLITGRALYAFNAGTMTGCTPNAELRAQDVLDISAQDAARLGVCSGDLVTVTSRYGSACLPAAVSPAVRAGEVFATFSTPALCVNRVTGPHRDPITHTPEYKLTAVRVEAARRSTR